MRLVFVGSGELGIPALKRFCAGNEHAVRLVVTQPDRPAGRRKRLTATPIAQLAEELGLSVHKTPKINTPDSLHQIQDAEPDAIVVAAFGQFIGSKVIESPRLGRIATINLHPSLLPKFRGAAPVHWALIRGETVTGNTVYSLVKEMDAGPILGAQTTEVDPMETAGELQARLAVMGADLLLDVLQQLETGTANPHEQDHAQATEAPKLSRADAALDFTQSAEDVWRRIHGLTPWPGVRVVCDMHHGELEIKLHRVKPVDASGKPGTLLEDGVIACGQGGIRLLEVQPSGKRVMTWPDFFHGHGVDLSHATCFRSAVQPAN